MENTAKKSFTIEIISPIISKIKGIVPWSKIKTKFDETYKEISKSVSIKGFRKGKVPRSLLQKMFGKHVKSDLVNDLIREDLVEILNDKDNEIRPVSNPSNWDVKPNELEDNKDLEYEVEFEVVPEIEAKDYKNHEVTRYIEKTKEEDIQSALEMLQRNNSTDVPVESGEVKAGHILNLTIMGKVENKPLSYENERIVIPENEDYDKNKVPLVIGASFIGRKIEDIQDDEEIEFEFPKETTEFSGKKGNLFIEFLGVKEVKIPELNDEFAIQTGQAETLDGLKENIKQSINKEKENHSKTLLEKELIGKILEKNSFEVGPMLIEKQAEMKINQTLMNLGFNGNIDALKDQKKSLIDTYKNQAEKEIKENLILESISKIEKMEATEEDITNKMEEISKETGESLERVKSEYNKEDKVETLKYIIKLNKTIEFLKSNSKIVDKEVDKFPPLEEPKEIENKK